MKEILGHKAYSITEYVEAPSTPQPYLLERMLYENGKMVLVAKPKSGKSWLSFKIGLSVALGEPLFGLRTKQASVLLLEFDRRYLKTTIQEIAKGRKAENMIIIPASAIPLNYFEGYRFLLASVQKSCPDNGQLVVIIDHKSACFAGKENEDAPNRHWLQHLDKVASVYPVTYLVVCQAPKGWRGETVDLPYGSRLLAAWADTIVSIQKPSRDTRRLEMVSNYGEIEPITYTKDFMVVRGDAQEETKLEAAITIIREEWGEFIYPNIAKKVTEVAEKVECGYSTAWAAYTEVKKLMKGIERTTQAPDSETPRDERAT